MRITKLIAHGAIVFAAACAVAPVSSPVEAVPTGGARPVLSLRAASSTVEIERFGTRRLPQSRHRHRRR